MVSYAASAEATLLGKRYFEPVKLKGSRSLTSMSDNNDATETKKIVRDKGAWEEERKETRLAGGKSGAQTQW